jgi:hypothetical protein
VVGAQRVMPTSGPQRPTPTPTPPPKPKSKEDRILEKFKTKNWNKLRMTDLDFKKRKALCRELCQHISKSLGIKKVPKITFCDGELGDHGRQKGDIIEINENYFYYPPEKIINTIAHETRHVYQDQKIANPATKLDYIWKKNNEHYIDYVPEKDNYKKYRNQPLEADAFNYGDQYSDYFLKNIDKK